MKLISFDLRLNEEVSIAEAKLAEKGLTNSPCTPIDEQHEDDDDKTSTVVVLDGTVTSYFN